MKTIILLFGVPSLVVILMHELTIFGYKIYPLIVKLLPFKPFTCELCLSFWTYLGVKITLEGFTYYTIFESFIAGMIGYLLSNKFLKF